MEVRAIAKYVRVSPRKIRILMEQVKGKKVEQALNELSFAPQRGAGVLRKLIQSAVGNATGNTGLDVDSLFVRHAYADAGPVLKRWRPRALGRATRIHKRTSHLTVILEKL